MNMQGTPKMCMDASIDQDFKAVLSHILHVFGSPPATEGVKPPPLLHEGKGLVRVSRDKALILITLILGSGILLRSTSHIPGVVVFSLEGRRNKTFYDTLLCVRGGFRWSTRYACVAESGR